MININVIGLDEVQKNLEKFSEGAKSEIAATVEAGAQLFVRNAKRDAPVNFGVLRNQITYNKIGELTFEVVSGAKYSAYNEWGTITHVNVPSDQSAYASQFRGRGIRRTGGMFPHPFFFIQAPVVEKQLETDMQKPLDSIKL